MAIAAANSIDRIFKAISDPTRLRILNLLLRGELCVCDIAGTLNIAQPAASKHLAFLRECELVEARRDGLWMYYQLIAPRSEFHKKLLDCLGCCSEEMPQLAKDLKQLQRTRCC